MNGDGRADLVTGNWAYHSTGSGFSSSYQLSPLAPEAGVLSDIDGDGRADFVFAKCGLNNGDVCSLYMSMSYGAGFMQPISLGVNAAVIASICPVPVNNSCAGWFRFFGPLALGDANGDSSADLIVGNSLRLATQIQPDLLIGIQQGLDANIAVTYRALSYPGAYTFESGSSYPIRDVLAAAPITVVTQVDSSNGLGGVTEHHHLWRRQDRHFRSRLPRFSLGGDHGCRRHQDSYGIAARAFPTRDCENDYQAQFDGRTRQSERQCYSLQ